MYPHSSIAKIVVVLLMVCLTVTASAQSATTARPDAPTYAQRGASPVGTREIVIPAESELPATIWYPALNPDALAESIVYPYVVKFDGLPTEGASVIGHAIADAEYDLSAAPYPLVVLSPGYAAGRSAYAWLAEHLASHGFVVIAPEHNEQLLNFDPFQSEFWRSAFTRPQEIADVFAYVDEQSAAGGILEGLLDPQTVAVIGHSYGGYTTLATGGAALDIPNFADRCAASAQDPDAWLCGLFTPHLTEMAAFVGLETFPDGLLSVFEDKRVDAIVPMAGDAYLFDQAGLAEISIPVMAISGSKDTGTPPTWGATMTYEHVSSATKALVMFENAEHMMFFSDCDALPWFAMVGIYAGCSDPVWDMQRAHDLTNHFTTAFLLAQLKQDGDAAAALAPDAVNFLGISYQSQGL